MFLDGVIWTAAMFAAAWLRSEFTFAVPEPGHVLVLAAVPVVVLWCVGAGTGVYVGRHIAEGVDEVLYLVTVSVAVTFATLVFQVATGPSPVPRSVPLIAAPLAFAVTLAARVVLRRKRARGTRPDPVVARRAIVYGADRRGEELVRALMSGAEGDMLPVAVLDDAPPPHRGRVAGVPFRGGGDRLPAVIGETGADLLIVASNTAPSRSLLPVARSAGIDVAVVPSLHDLLDSRARTVDVRPVDLAEQLRGPREVPDLRTLSVECLAGRRVLVTGAGGSIGAELCRQLHRLEPAEVVLLDRDESALHAVQLSIHGRARLDVPEVVLADIRDAATVHSVLCAFRPDVVYHAAALKHLATLERYPDEAWKTNVLGTINVLEAAQAAGVGWFVNISSDKAANPTSVLGRSKRLGERLVAEAARRTGENYLSVRFGNVLGSRGSVLTTFAEQLACGGPITVTHPDATRYLMTVPEAVALVIHAAAIGSAGEVLVLDMGDPARIADLAEAVMAISGRSAPVVYTGLGRGEKLHEELFGAGEEDRRPGHPAVSQVPVPPLTPAAALDRAAELGVNRALVALVAEGTHDVGVDGMAGHAADPVADRVGVGAAGVLAEDGGAA